MKAITAFLVAVGIGVAAAFNADNWSSVGSLAKQTIAAPASAKDLFHAALIFQVAEAHAGQKATPNCQSLSDFTSRQSKLSDVAYAVRGSRLLGCSPPSSALDQLADSLKSSRLTDLFHAVGGLNKNSDAAEVSRVIDTVLSLQEGVLFRTSKKSRASVLAAGLAFHVLSDVARHLDSSLSSTHKKQLSDVLKSAPSLLATAKRNEDGTLTLSDNDPLLVTYLALTGVHSLAVTLGEVSPIAVPTDTLSGLAAMLQPYASSGDVVAVGQSLAALQTLCKGAPQVFRAVLVVESQSPVVEAGATGTNGDLVVAVQDVFGFTPRSVQVKLNSVTTSNGAAVGALAGKTFTQEGNNFKVPFASSISEPGIYDAVVDVEVPGDAKWASGASTVRVKATGGIIVGPAFLHESRARQSDAKTRGTRVEFPDQSGKAFSIQERQYFHVAFEVKDSSKAPMSVHQAFVAFTDRISGKTVTVVATPAETGLYAAVIEPSAFPASISSGKREFDVTAIIGDALVKEGVSWRLGSLSVAFPEASEQHEVLYTKPLLHESDVTLKPLKEITHQFRAPDSRPPALLSIIFAALAVAPLVLLLGGLAKTKAFSGFRGIPATAYLHGFLFIGGLGVTFAVLIAYWFVLNMFQALMLLAAPLLVTFISGTFLFRALSSYERPE